MVSQQRFYVQYCLVQQHRFNINRYNIGSKKLISRFPRILITLHQRIYFLRKSALSRRGEIFQCHGTCIFFFGSNTRFFQPAHILLYRFICNGTIIETDNIFTQGFPHVGVVE